jgi:hypothetical protein
MVKYNPLLEVLVFEAVESLGEGTREEVFDFMKNNLEIPTAEMQGYIRNELTSSELLRYLGRWKTKKIITLSSRSGEEVWRLSDVPPWYRQKVAAALKLQKDSDMRAELKALHDRWKESGQTVSQPTRKWGKFKNILITWETVDPILGGRPSLNSNEKLYFPKVGDKPVIPPNWFYGWMRDNIALIGDSGTQYHVAFGMGKFLDEVELGEIKQPAKVGFTHYEVVPPGKRFRALWRFPFRGSSITEPDQLKSFLDLLAEAPIRGLGANSRAYGGRVKVLDFQVQE